MHIYPDTDDNPTELIVEAETAQEAYQLGLVQASLSKGGAAYRRAYTEKTVCLRLPVIPNEQRPVWPALPANVPARDEHGYQPRPSTQVDDISTLKPPREDIATLAPPNRDTTDGRQPSGRQEA